MVGPIQEIVQPCRQLDPVLCKLREMLEPLVNLMLEFMEPSIPALLLAVAIVVVYALQHLFRTSFARRPLGRREGLAFRRELGGRSRMSIMVCSASSVVSFTGMFRGGL